MYFVVFLKTQFKCLILKDTKPVYTKANVKLDNMLFRFSYLNLKVSYNQKNQHRPYSNQTIRRCSVRLLIKKKTVKICWQIHGMLWMGCLLQLKSLPYYFNVNKYERLTSKLFVKKVIMKKHLWNYNKIIIKS